MEESKGARFREDLLRTAPEARDGWVDRAFGLESLPDDDPNLPRGCVFYLPCGVDALLRVIEHAPVRASDVFVDIGSGVGRAAALVHLLTGARAVGLEIQSQLVVAARDLANRLHLSGVTFVEGDAAKVTNVLDEGSVFFLYCPFSGARLTKTLADLELVARRKRICVCTLDLPLPPCPWLTLQEVVPPGDLSVYRSLL